MKADIELGDAHVGVEVRAWPDGISLNIWHDGGHGGAPTLFILWEEVDGLRTKAKRRAAWMNARREGGK